MLEESFGRLTDNSSGESVASGLVSGKNSVRYVSEGPVCRPVSSNT